MADIIKLLPDSVANQIAAGEVIQRPASVVKELVENAIDAGSTKIIVNIKDAGKTLIQVIDNGSGMSETDARMAFERHATSKITKADDLFNLHTMGFRGEALASIAAVAHVELRTKKIEEEIGLALTIAGSEVISQEPVNCANGSNFQIKNLFYNVPARRKFLKADATEFGHIITEFQRVSLGFPQIAFSLYHNDNEIYNFQPGKLKTRIVSMFGKQLNPMLAPIQTESDIIKIYGYIGNPKIARKNTNQQFFYVNNRFMKSGYFHKAVLLAYDQLLPEDVSPVYFICFEIDPKMIDVNIHPTKTEINFEDASSVFQILKAIIREAINKFSIAPQIDFDTEGAIDIPYLSKNTEIKIPEIEINPDYNPFEEKQKQNFDFHQKISSASSSSSKNSASGWEKLYQSFENQAQEKQQTLLSGFAGNDNENDETASRQDRFFQLKSRYILTPVKSGLMIIDQKRAHEQILFEQNLARIEQSLNDTQQLLFPENCILQPDELVIFNDIAEELHSIGFVWTENENGLIEFTGIPAFTEHSGIEETIRNFIADYRVMPASLKTSIKEQFALSQARKKSIAYGKILSPSEMGDLIDNLFACTSPSINIEGKTILTIFKYEELEKRF